MIRTNKLDIVIPGYTGYIPQAKANQESIPDIPKRNGHIPGYSGYVNKIVPENLHGKTFGRITYEIHKDEIDEQERFKTSYQNTFVDQQTVEEKPVQGVRCLSETLKIQKDFRETLKGNTMYRPQDKENCPKQFITGTIPGYQGHIPGIYSENIFGHTYKEAQKQAERTIDKIDFQKTNTFNNQSKEIPNLYTNHKSIIN